MLVYCKLCIPGGGRAEPDRNRGWTDLLDIGFRAEVAQSAVRPAFVVFPPVVPDDDPGLCEGVDLLPVQAFVTEPAVVAFHEAVLPRAARFGVQGPDPVLLESLTSAT